MISIYIILHADIYAGRGLLWYDLRLFILENMFFVSLLDANSNELPTL